MNIAFVMGSISRKAGGLHESVRRLAQSIDAMGAKTEVFCLRDEFTQEDNHSWEPVPVHPSKVYGPGQFGFAPGLFKALHTSDAKAVMSHGLWMYPSAAVTYWHVKSRKPYIVHPHGMLDPWAIRNSAWKKKIAATLYEDAHLKGAACIRALCRSEAESIRNYGLRNPIAIIPNGIDVPDNSDSDSADYGMLGPSKQNGKKVLLFLSRIHPKKGLVNLIKAWSVIQTSKPSTLNSKPSDWVLAIAGWDQGGHEGELKRLATDLGVKWSDLRSQSSGCPSSAGPSSDSLYFLGPQFNGAKAQCYRACDAFILPSFSEGLPMVVLEAWAHSKPVLMTSGCNLPEGYASGAAIRIIPEPESIASGIEQLSALSNAEREQMGQNGCSLAKDRFAWPKIGAEMIQVYDWVLGRGEKPACVQT